jgi:hypothetical protein
MLMPILPILLVTGKDEKIGHFHTHFLFFTNNLAQSLKNYINSEAKTLKDGRGTIIWSFSRVKT